MIKMSMFLNLMFIMYMFTTIFIIMNFNIHPIFFMITLIIYNILLCLNLYMWKMNYMYSILLFLIMISGLLIIFLYFSSLISNNQIMSVTNNKFLIIIYLINLIIMNFIMNTNYKMIFNNFMNFQCYDSKILTNINMIMHYNYMTLYKYPFINLTIISMIYLLISMILVMKMCLPLMKPMRKIL